ncbi:MAG: FAD-binding oxidoreductase [Promethearchaeota archaeon]|nr:MAG: FAD-binding oxidoreductase [Candidatus Lokiarchaeota archaeon]
MNTLDELVDIVGVDYVSEEDFILESYARGIHGVGTKRPSIVVIPESAKEISEILKVANKEKLNIIPRGGGAGLLDGVLPLVSGGIIIDMTRMNNILNFNEDTLTVTVECGITWGKLNSFLMEKGFYTGTLGPGSGMSAVVGGGLSHHSVGGGGAAKYGSVTRHCVGLEVVLPNGKIITTGSGASKYINEPFSKWGFGPDYLGLFMGDQGIHGIKTRATLLIYPRPKYRDYKTFSIKRRGDKFWPKIVLKLRKRGELGLYDVFYYPQLIMQAFQGRLLQKDIIVFKAIREHDPKGRAVMFYTMEAETQEALESNQKIVDEIFLNNKGISAFGPEIDDGNIAKWHYEMNGHWQTYHGFWGVLGEGSIPQTTEHHLPAHQYSSLMRKFDQWEAKNSEMINKVRAMSGVGSSLLCDHTTVEVDSGLTVFNKPEYHEINEKIWKSHLEMVIKSGGMPYMAGMRFSRALIDVSAFSDDFYEFMGAIKNTLDPNHILSKGKYYFE